MTYKPDGDRVTRYQIAGALLREAGLALMIVAVSFACGWLARGM
jgi:hypothetical protein